MALFMLSTRATGSGSWKGNSGIETFLVGGAGNRADKPFQGEEASWKKY
jgi:hypothetical protein